MKNAATKRDLLILVPDRNTEAALCGLFTRRESLGMRAITPDIRKHPEKDSGCRTNGVEFLNTFIASYEHALLLFDHEGSGAEQNAAESIEEAMESMLGRAGWDGRAAVIIFQPELEAWVWADSPHVDITLGWKDKQPRLKEWLAERGFWETGALKPYRPKEAMEAALRAVKKPRSSALYQSLAERVSLTRCQDRAFLKFKSTMRSWFG